MLSPTQINQIADKINSKVDLPLLGENQEKQLFMTVINQIANLLSTTMPKQYQAMLNDPKQGIETNEANKIGNELMQQITSKVNMGMLGSVGKSIATSFVETIVAGLQKGGKI
ncbi:hypothetical protein [Thermoflexibacter ruber]|uniref:Uncharacterized protein n=1 Tax=Thermoflexibacter ruber TaxID=1003 RepID=A0A1I2CR56_9BACT|nr:hypothetical protein [Thermoflexibacter ruber]SFE70220.1 hypothetical protein SAMN04488541_1005101 [Thermoflexibacter ruber]